MNVRVTIDRTVRQYADILVPDCESPAEAERKVTIRLQDPVQRVRFLKDISWYGTEREDPERVVYAEAVNA